MGRRLGQHFLRAASVERLVRLIDPRPDDVFLEIGPGGGALSLPLAARAKEVVAVELDDALAARLVGRAPNVRVVHGDALQIDLASLVPAGSRLAGNLPYAISSPLLRRFLDRRARFRDMHVMLQKEVARRIAAAPGSKEYGILSVLYAVWTETDVPLQFGAREFDPPPKVDSAVLRARFLPGPRVDVGDPARFERLVQRAFAHRRKTLENNLKDSYPNLKDYLRLLNIQGGRRAETLSVVDFAELSRRLVVD
jgi:16S rRNA (adenine1518-N6/adenine1519-N6)-dimethyltransferase